jgi:hypothetical protein
MILGKYNLFGFAALPRNRDHWISSADGRRQWILLEKKGLLNFAMSMHDCGRQIPSTDGSQALT